MRAVINAEARSTVAPRHNRDKTYSLFYPY
jgi:hypothetical protein